MMDIHQFYDAVVALAPKRAEVHAEFCVKTNSIGNRETECKCFVYVDFFFSSIAYATGVAWEPVLDKMREQLLTGSRCHEKAAELEQEAKERLDKAAKLRAIGRSKS